jgi:hypothetical protein
MENKKKETNKGKGKITLSHRPSVVGSHSLGFSFDADFLQFLSETTPCVDFSGYVRNGEEISRVYKRNNVPAKQIPRSVVKRILSKPDAYPFAHPAYQLKKPNCKLFGIGNIPSSMDLKGVRHLRIEFEDDTLIFIATRQKLTYLEAIECSAWFRTAMGLSARRRGDAVTRNNQYIPVPVTFDDGKHNAKAELVDGDPLNIPDFPTRATFMIEMGVPSWELRSYTLNERSRIGPYLYQSTHPQEVMSMASGIAHYELASGLLCDDEIAELIANHFGKYLEKYRKDRELALLRGHQYLQATKNRIRSQDIPY